MEEPFIDGPTAYSHNGATAQAVAAERESCARLAEEALLPRNCTLPFYDSIRRKFGLYIAAKIRARP